MPMTKSTNPRPETSNMVNGSKPSSEASELISKLEDVPTKVQAPPKIVA